MSGPVKISDLPTGSALTGAEKVPVVQSGVTIYTLVSAIGTYVRGLFTTTPATIAEGGTNAATAAAARASLGVVGLTGNETIAGNKTLSGTTSFTGPTVFDLTVASPENLLTGICEGRLTLVSGNPVPTTDVTAAETLYYTPYKGNRVAVKELSGSAWKIYRFDELSIDIPDATNCYDVFIKIASGQTMELELLAWTNPTTRAGSLSYLEGVLSRNGLTSRRYLGTFYSTTAGNGQVEDSYIQRNLWNYYNRVLRPMRVTDATDSWTYTTAVYRQARATAANQLEYVQGISEDPIEAEVMASCANGAASTLMAAGIGVDSTSANSATLMPSTESAVANIRTWARAHYLGYPGVGRHVLPWLEYSAAANTTTWYGDNGTPVIQSGIYGKVWG